MAWVRGKLEEVGLKMSPGDVIAFGRSEDILGFAKLWTQSTIAHVAVILQLDQLEDEESHMMFSQQIIESTPQSSGLSGVSVHILHNRLEEYEGNIWWLPLNDETRQKLDSTKFQYFLMQQVGKPYDSLQKAQSALDAVDTATFIQRITRGREDFSMFFSSELVAAGLESGGAIESLNASEVTPADLCSFSIYQEKYYQLKGNKTLIKNFNAFNPEGWGEQLSSLSIKEFIFHYPAMLALVTSGILLTILLFQEFLTDRFSLILGPSGMFRDFRLAVIHCILAGFLPSACLFLFRGLRNTNEELEGVVRPANDSSFKDFLERIGRNRLIVWGSAGLLVAVFSPFLTAETPPWDPTNWNPEVWWHRILGLFIGWWLGWFILAIWHTSTQTSHLADRIEEIDLLNLAPLHPFVKQGLLNSLLVVTAMTLFGLFLIEPDQWPVVVVIIAVCLPLAVISLMLPLRGVHAQIREAKQTELEWIHEKIRDSRSLIQEYSRNDMSGKMADQITYQRLIEDVPEWPIQSSTLLRVFVFLLIPLASWIGSLLIEGVLDHLLR